jgi:CBS domain-containing protein
MLKSIKVGDYMTRNLMTFKPDMDLYEAIDRLLSHRVSGAPVVDAHGHLLGLVSAGDCLQRVLKGAYHEESGGTVETCMTRNVRTITPDTDIMQACELMLNDDFRRLPVLKDGRLVGQISRHDLLRAAKEFAQHDLGKRT